MAELRLWCQEVKRTGNVARMQVHLIYHLAKYSKFVFVIFIPALILSTRYKNIVQSTFMVHFCLAFFSDERGGHSDFLLLPPPPPRLSS